MKEIIILGAGGHGRVVLDICRANGQVVKGFIDPGVAAGAKVDGVVILGGDTLIDDCVFVAAHRFAVAFGDIAIRRRNFARLKSQHADMPLLIHPFSSLSQSVGIGAATVIMAGAVINNAVRIGDYAIVNTGARIDHDCRIGDGAHICPGVTLAGNVDVGAGTFVGSGSVVGNGQKIGANTIIGAGSVVVEDVPAQVLAFGNPCRVISQITN